MAMDGRGGGAAAEDQFGYKVATDCPPSSIIRRLYWSVAEQFAIGDLPELASSNPIDFLQPVRPLQHFPGLAAVRRANNAVAIHHIENPRRASVAETQTTL